MKARWFAPLLAVLALLLAAVEANAGYCGCARYCCCAPCCQMECHTVMKTVHCMEYEQQQITCYKTCWDRVCEEHIVNCVKYVPETRTREECYTVCKPRWETKTCNYTVCKPCCETKTREICYTVCKPGWETKTCCYTVCKPVLRDQDPRHLLHGLQAGAGKPRLATTRSASRRGKPRPALLHDLQAGLGNQDPRHLLHGLQAVLGNQDLQLHGLRAGVGNQDLQLHDLQASLGNQDPGSVLHSSEAGSLYEDDPGSERSLGNRSRTRFRARRTPKCVREPGCWTYDRLRLPLLLLPRQVPHGMCPMPADQVLQKKWVPECVHERDLLHAV